jgi:hypothetical protein
VVRDDIGSQSLKDLHHGRGACRQVVRHITGVILGRPVPELSRTASLYEAATQITC